MVRGLIVLVVGAVLLLACNALSGAGDLYVCDDCLLDAGPAPSVEDGSPPIDVVPKEGDGGEAPPADSDCDAAAGSCYGRVLAECVDGKWKLTDCPEACEAAACAPWPSCRNAAGSSCGASKTNCCETRSVPGGTFNRQNDAAYPATVSPFALDLYEVTVGRFRAFVESGGGTKDSPPTLGAGAHPKITGSGWQSTWDTLLPADSSALRASLADGTWTSSPGSSEARPITSVDWFVAFAFCAWDDARLPTYAEWNFAASGGSEQRVYPWPSTSISDANAARYCRYSMPGYSCVQVCSANGRSPCDATACADLGGACTPSCSGCDITKDVANVGVLAAGAGRWGHFDLAGNASELVLDAKPRKVEDPLPMPCVDCAMLMGTQPAGGTTGPFAKPYDVFSAGGGWRDEVVKTTVLTKHKYADRDDSTGFRCARDRTN